MSALAHFKAHLDRVGKEYSQNSHTWLKLLTGSPILWTVRSCCLASALVPNTRAQSASPHRNSPAV